MKFNLSEQSSRRDWLKLAGAGAVAGLTGAGVPRLLGQSPAVAQSPLANAGRAIRIAHLTDVHLQPERGAADGLVQCLDHLQSQADKPDLILITGDCIMDSFRKDRARTQLQWDLWNTVMKAECSIPVQPLLGNHDIWGWDQKKSKTTGNEDGWGKKWAMDQLGLDKPYRSFDQAGWHFVMLDSVQPFEERQYTAHLDEAQMDWLKSDLAANVGKPTMILSHIPILSITPIMGREKPKPEEDQSSVLNHNVMHTDWRELKALFKQNPQVKLAVSGHLHLIDRLDYSDVSYFCNGAVSGGWWKKPHLEDGDAGYVMIDLHRDGKFHREDYQTYGWVYRDDASSSTAGAKLAPADGKATATAVE